MSIINGIVSDDPNYTPTYESVFGGSPFVTPAPVVTGPGCGANGTTLNNKYYATTSAAQSVLTMLSGSEVVMVDQYAGNKFYHSSAPMAMIEVGGIQLNAGQVATLFGHGYTLSEIAEMLEEIVRLAKGQA
jgi:hypothetical protein